MLNYLSDPTPNYWSFTLSAKQSNGRTGQTHDSYWQRFPERISSIPLQ